MKTLANCISVILLLTLNAGYSNAQLKHEYVDLGLPSGTLWATCNVGAENPWDYGDYFAWGETTTKSNYDWSTYKYANDDYRKITKYCGLSVFGDNGYTDTLTILECSDDAAFVNWGSDWCMPTELQFRELNDNCTWILWTIPNGKDGYEVKGFEVKGKNGNSIFLPATGYRNGTVLYDASKSGDYWSSSLSTGDPENARHLYFNSGGGNPDHGGWRRCGMSVRPVRSNP